MKTRTILFFALLIIMPAASYGQLGRLLKNAANKVVSSTAKETAKEANKEIDSSAQAKTQKMIDEKAAEQNQGNQDVQNQPPSNQGGKGINIGGLFGGKVDIKHGEDFTFNSRMYMQMEIYDKKDVVKMDYFLYFSTNSPNAGMEMKAVASSEGETVPVSTNMIVDGENKCFMMLSDINGMKMGMISAMPDPTTVQTAEKNEKPVKPPVVTKTGNSRVVAGYKCDEYIYKEADSKEYTKLWLTKEAVFNVDKRVWSKANMPAAYNYAGFEGMVVLAYELYDKDGKMSAKSETKEINKNYSHSMSAKGYNLRQMNFNQMQGQKK
jgi:hypothetical protein